MSCQVVSGGRVEFRDFHFEQNNFRSNLQSSISVQLTMASMLQSPLVTALRHRASTDSASVMKEIQTMMRLRSNTLNNFLSVKATSSAPFGKLCKLPFRKHTHAAYRSRQPGRWLRWHLFCSSFNCSRLCRHIWSPLKTNKDICIKKRSSLSALPRLHYRKKCGKTKSEL